MNGQTEWEKNVLSNQISGWDWESWDSQKVRWILSYG